MTTDYPSIPTPGRGDYPLGERQNLDLALSCLPAEDKPKVLRASIGLITARMTELPEVFSLAHSSAGELGSHLLGHVLQVGLLSARAVIEADHGPVEMFAVAHTGCDEPDHQLTHEFVQDFSSDVLNLRFEDSMDRWRQFLTDASEDYSAYMNGVYGVTTMALVAQQGQLEQTDQGTVVQLVTGVAEEG